MSFLTTLALIFVLGVGTASSQQVFEAFLSSGSEVNPTMSLASGQVTATLTGSTLVVSGSFSGLSSDFNANVAGGSHIHTAYAGQNGGIAIGLNATIDADSRGGTWDGAGNTFQLTAAQVTALKERRLYVNVHTVNFAGGEIRGQLLPKSDAYYEVIMSGGWEIPEVPTTARGALVVELKGDIVHVSGSFSGLSSTADVGEGAAHIHWAGAGGVGAALFGLTPKYDANYKGGVFNAQANSFRLTPSQINVLKERRLYADLHSIIYPSGEIRGQILPASNLYFQGRLSGINEVQPNPSGASGGIAAELLGDQLVVTGTFSGLNSDFNAAIAGGAHLHIGGPDGTGGVTIPLNTRLDTPRIGHFDASSNTFTLTEEQMENLFSGMLYANVHTKNRPAGEVRSTVRLSPNNAPVGPPVDSPATGSSMNSGGPSNAPFEVSWSPVDDPDGNPVVYIWQLSRSTDFGGGQLLANVNVGFQTSFSTTLEALSAILTTANLPLGKARTFYHRVIASDGSASAAGPVASLRITRGALGDPIPAPDVVTLASPADGATGVAIPVVLEWNNAANADQYLVQVSSDAAFSDTLFSVETGDLTAEFLPSYAGATYYWRVLGMGIGGESADFSDVWSFTVGLEGSLVPVLVSPEDGATGVAIDVTLSWQAPAATSDEDAVSKAAAVVSYHVQLSASADFASTTLDQSEIVETSLGVSGLAHGTEYFWRVAGVDEEGNFTFSAANHFTTIVAAPGAVALVAPMNGASGLSAKVSFSWQAVARAETYQIQVSKDAGFATTVIDEAGLTATSYAPADPFEYSTTYYWRVRGANEGGTGAWSNVRSFSTGVGTATEDEEIPAAFALHGNYPNPFNPSTQIAVDLPEAISMRLVVYDVTGHEVMVLASGQMPAGHHMFTVDGSNLASGMYLYRIESAKFTQTRQMMLLK